MSSKITPRQVIQPGPSTIEAAGALEDRRRLVGRYPYQWIFPGPNSRHVLAGANSAQPVPAGAGSLVTVVIYEVPDGLRFSLRGIVFGFDGTGWQEGTQTGLAFTLQVQAAGTRNVDFLANVTTHLGSPDQPYPILGRLEFAPLDTLVVIVTNLTGQVAAGPPNVVFAHLVGHTYPNSEVMG